MKRKVAAKGRQGREFSWSMSVKTGRKGIPEASKRRKRADTADVRLAPRKTCHSPEFVPSRCCWAGANSVFSEKAGNTRSSVEGECPPCKSQAVPERFLIIILGRAQTSEI